MPKYGEAGNKLTRAVTAAELLTAMGATIGGTTFTQTYSTASATHSNLTAAALTDSSGGSANTTLSAVTVPTALTVTDGTGTNDGTIGAITGDASVIAAVQELAASCNASRAAISVMRDSDADLAAQCNALLTDLTNAKQVINKIIDALQAAGIVS